ncbi:MAG: heat-inducible transcription repressor HrcA [Bacilli bacterium]|nr:heat-inducible transcription repressor HrcA [Bacilli bacterium]
MLTDRQKEILKLIVLNYIQLAKPVGSKLLCKRLNCSSATVRSEMATLEELDLLEKTHTSSGRIPSEKGYRYYVDHLMNPKEINGEDMLKLQIIFRNNELELSDCLNQSLKLIAEMTSYTSIVLGKTSHENHLKEVSVVPLNSSEMITIVITDKGHVEHKKVSFKNVSLEEIKRAVELINDLIVGTPIDEVSSKLEFEIKPIIGRYVKEHEIVYNTFYQVFKDFSNLEEFSNEQKYAHFGGTKHTRRSQDPHTWLRAEAGGESWLRIPPVEGSAEAGRPPEHSFPRRAC